MNRRATILGLTGYLFIGTAAVLIPSVMPLITAEFMAAGLSLAAIGFIFPARAAGGIIGNLLAGFGSDLLGRSKLVWLSALCLAAALAATAIAPTWLLFLTALVATSLAQAGLATGINALVADANPNARGRALNVLHGVYGAGAAVSPLVIGFLLGGSTAWRWAMGVTAIIWLVYALVYAYSDRDATATPQVAHAAALDWSMLRNASFLALFTIAFVYNGVATSLLGWIAVYMQQSVGVGPFQAVAMITVFYLALTTGRFVCAHYAERIGYAPTLLILACAILVTYPLVVLEWGVAWVVAGVFLTGLSLSGLFPTALAYGSRLYPAQTGSMTGVLNVAMSLGATVPPLWTGFLAERWGFQVALAANAALIPLLILAALTLHRTRIAPAPTT